jgi:hypothetical protein
MSLKRGRAYGTILVDLERRRPVDLRPDRTAETLARWLARCASSLVQATCEPDRLQEQAQGPFLHQAGLFRELPAACCLLLRVRRPRRSG